MENGEEACNCCAIEDQASELKETVATVV